MLKYNYKSYASLADDIKKTMHILREKNPDLIVGIPRSGLLPATIIALELNIDVIDLDGLLQNKSISRGETRKKNLSLQRSHDAENILLVDDSVLSGNSIRLALTKIPKILHQKITTVVVYAPDYKNEDVDIVLHRLSLPRLFEWNLMHRDVLETACVDIDGVLCEDPSDYENDDGKRYKSFLMNANPKLIPSVKVHSLVTNRLEKYREETEKWLLDNGVKYDSLIMLDLPSQRERKKKGEYYEHKATYYGAHVDLNLFIESDAKQAAMIAKVTGKPVYCVENNSFMQNSSLALAAKAPIYAGNLFIRRLRYLLPSRWKNFLKSIFLR